MTDPYKNIGNGFAEVVCDKKRYIDGSKCWECPSCGQEGCDGFSDGILSEGVIECPYNGREDVINYDI
jgi:hypothetical protein